VFGYDWIAGLLLIYEPQKMSQAVKYAKKRVKKAILAEFSREWQMLTG
jgi:hypothetical protein